MKIKVIEREVLNPLADTDALKIEINPISKKIDYISFLDNTKPNADLLLDIIRENLDFKSSTKVEKPAGAPGTDEQIRQAKADLCILALGDCGSCTTWLILDAIKLEKQGNPTISVCSDIFAPFARELAESYGAGQLRIVEVEHPLAGQSKESIENKAQKVVNQIKNMLK
ncbi:MAG TPA: UGSC family (seleno)protein [Methanobacterium sp.]